MEHQGEGLKGKKVVISGSGNVAQYAAEKVIQLGGTVLTLSDSSGYIYDKGGIDQEKLSHIMELKNKRRARVNVYLKKYPKAEFFDNSKPWEIPCDIALPCATQNELAEKEDRKSTRQNSITA